MSKKRSRHLLANDMEEVKFQREEDRRLYEKKRNSPIVIRPSMGRRNGIVRTKNLSCLWELAKYILAPLILLFIIGLFKACGL